MGYKTFSIVLTGVQEDAIVSNFAATVLIFVLDNCKIKGIKTAIKIAFRIGTTLRYFAWVSSKEWMFFQEHSFSVQCTASDLYFWFSIFYF